MVYLCVSECICVCDIALRMMNVSNVGGDPVTQLIVNVYQMKFIPQIHM